MSGVADLEINIPNKTFHDEYMAWVHVVIDGLHQFPLDRDDYKEILLKKFLCKI